MFHKRLILKLFANKTGLIIANVIGNHLVVVNKLLVNVFNHFLSICVESLARGEYWENPQERERCRDKRKYNCKLAFSCIAKDF